MCWIQSLCVIMCLLHVFVTCLIQWYSLDSKLIHYRELDLDNYRNLSYRAYWLYLSGVYQSLWQAWIIGKVIRKRNVRLTSKSTDSCIRIFSRNSRFFAIYDNLIEKLMFSIIFVQPQFFEIIIFSKLLFEQYISKSLGSRKVLS